MSASPSAVPTREQVSAATMRFMQQLAVDINKPGLSLPSYPQVTLRLQRLLADPNTGSDTVAKAISTEPVLAARILAMANSAANSRVRNTIVDLPTAISTLGFDALRTAAISFALSQLRQAAAYRAIEKPMVELWTHSVNVAATSHVLACHYRRLAPDTAMLSGLVSDVGKLYILVHAHAYPELFNSPENYQDVVSQWHTQVARSILENWRMNPEIIDAVSEVHEAALDQRARVMMVDIVATAQLLVDTEGSAEVLAAVMPEHMAAQRLGLNAENSVELIANSAAELASLRSVLGM